MKCLTTLALLALLAQPFAGVTASSQDLGGVKIALDPGHGGSDSGATGYGLEEKEVVLDVALRAQELLEAAGANVIMTRTTDTYVSLTDRADIANNAGADRFISVHANACGFCGGHGTETYYHSSLSSTSTAARLAGDVQEEAVYHLGTRDRGVKQADFSVLRNTWMPAALLELAFIDHPDDNAKLASDTYRQEAARGILHAVQKHYGFTPWDPVMEYDVSVVSPDDGATVSGTVLVKGEANQPENVQWMRVKVDGTVTKWISSPPHEWWWDTTAWGNGWHTVTIESRATDDTLASDSVSVYVSN